MTYTRSSNNQRLPVLARIQQRGAQLLRKGRFLRQDNLRHKHRNQRRQQRQHSRQNSNRMFLIQ
jgi:hypothetical protein